MDSENFSLFFSEEVKNMHEYQKERLPKSLLFKVFKRGSTINPKNTSKLRFVEKIYILWKALMGEFFIVIRRDEGGISTDDFTKIIQLKTDKDLGIESAQSLLISNGIFVTGGKELCEALGYLNQLSASPAYNYLLRAKNSQRSKISEWRQSSVYISRFLANYEATKKKLVMNTGISMPEFYVLLYLYDGTERKSSEIYLVKFKYSYNSSRSQIQRAFVTLQNKGYIIQNGNRKWTKLKITSLGCHFLDEIIEKYLVDF